MGRLWCFLNQHDWRFVRRAGVKTVYECRREGCRVQRATYD